jgi:hypothetical protein
LLLCLLLSPRPELGPQYGGNRHPIAGGISKLLQLNDPEVVGVFAQLGYVNEPRLSSVLAANYASTLQVGRVGTRRAEHVGASEQ